MAETACKGEEESYLSCKNADIEGAQEKTIGEVEGVKSSEQRQCEDEVEDGNVP